MDIVTEKYIRKPLIVDAVQVTADNFAEIAKWCSGEILNNDETEPGDGVVNPGGQFIRIRVSMPKNVRQTRAYVGDWVLWAERGGYKIYTQRTFEEAFDKHTTES